MKILSDENIDRAIIERLRATGHDVVSVVEDSPGLSDERVAELIEKHKALFLTEDKNFVDLLFWRKQCQHGVVLIRLNDSPSDVQARIVAEAMGAHSFQMVHSITAITSKTIRVRKI